MSEHRVIYLEPRCAAEAGEDRHWCQDDAWGTCDECGTPSVKYIIASEHADLVKALEEAREALAGCYNVADWPADGTTGQDRALATVERVLACVKGAPDHG